MLNRRDTALSVTVVSFPQIFVSCFHLLEVSQNILLVILFTIYFNLRSSDILEATNTHTLNYLGGSSQPVRTTKLNISRMESRLPRLLTKTFRDAITITRSLSVQYLWIDSLCIIQDDKQDWEKESGLMASIYENAYLVISAAHASDGSKGCFSEHPAPKETLTPFYSHITLDGSSIPFYLRHETQISHQAYQSNTLFILWESSVPLHFRAWALQERILATRIVHFTDEELVWECHKSVRCECMSMDHDSSHINNPLLKQLWRVGIRGDDHSPGPKYNRFSIWHTILETYTRLDITKPSDRLPALSGLAKKMQGAGAGNYLAGLWENNLLCDLLWMGGTYSTNTKRAGTWQSPSWSWAGLQLEPDEWISHTFSNYAVVAGTTISLNTHNLMLAAKNEMATTVNKIECKAAGYDETGEVSQGASLTISAPTISVSAIANLKQDRNCKMEIHKGGQVLHFKADCMADFSSNDHDKGTFNLVCVWIGTIRFEDWILPQTIVLRRSNGIGGVAATPNAYERVGVLYPMGYPNNSDAETITEWFKDAELRVVKIV